MFKVTVGMPEQPNACVHCGACPSNDDGTYKQAIFSDGVDIDWGNSVYTCWDCAELIADLVGRATRGGFDELTAKYEALLEAHAELEINYERQEALIDKIRQGAAATKTLREKSAA